MAEGIRKSFCTALIKQSYCHIKHTFGNLIDKDKFKEEMKKIINMNNVFYSESRKGKRCEDTLSILDTAIHDTLQFFRLVLTLLRTDLLHIYELACEDVEEETHQAMEALIHNFNSLHSRAGSLIA